MGWTIIATWRMALEGVTKGSEILKEEGCAFDAIEEAIKCVEDNPRYGSVGYGGLPNYTGVVELDAAYMNGDTLGVGAVAGIKDYANPISIAKKLSEDRFNIFLVGSGADAYAHTNGFERKNMLTEAARKTWQERLKEVNDKNLSPYDGHDTVGMVVLDHKHSMAAATSTSGLFMKKPGRIGDSALSGSGLYVDSEVGGATATGLGEDIMKGCLSYEVVRRMSEGASPQEAADCAVQAFSEKLKRKNGVAGAISLVCANHKGEWGVGTNVEFSFVVATDQDAPKVYLANLENGKTVFKEVHPSEIEDK